MSLGNLLSQTTLCSWESPSLLVFLWQLDCKQKCRLQIDKNYAIISQYWFNFQQKTAVLNALYMPILALSYILANLCQLVTVVHFLTGLSIVLSYQSILSKYILGYFLEYVRITFLIKTQLLWNCWIYPTWFMELSCLCDGALSCNRACLFSYIL